MSMNTKPGQQTPPAMSNDFKGKPVSVRKVKVGVSQGTGTRQPSTKND